MRRYKTTSDFDREKLQERLAKLAGGVAVIRVGAATETEMKEAKPLTVNDDCILFLHLNRFCTAKLIHGSFFQLQAKLGTDHLSACQDRDIL